MLQRAFEETLREVFAHFSEAPPLWAQIPPPESPIPKARSQRLPPNHPGLGRRESKVALQPHRRQP